MTTPTEPANNLQSDVIYPDKHALMFVVRKDGMPGLHVMDGVTRERAAQLLEAMARAVRTDPRWDHLG